MKNDLSIFKIFLLKYSSIFGIIENQTGIITGINTVRKKIDKDFNIWSNEIVNNYNNYMPPTSQLKKYTENNNL